MLTRVLLFLISLVTVSARRYSSSTISTAQFSTPVSWQPPLYTPGRSSIPNITPSGGLYSVEFTGLLPNIPVPVPNSGNPFDWSSPGNSPAIDPSVAWEAFRQHGSQFNGGNVPFNSR